MQALPLRIAPAEPPAGEMFLHLVTAGAGKAKGEARATGHEDDIQVLGWRWGASAPTAMGGKVDTARRAYRQLVVVKAVDAASVVLLTALRDNDEVSEATLAMRKRGGASDPYFKVVLKSARVASIDYAATESGLTCEEVTLTFAKIQIEYHAQGSDGELGPALVFDDVV